MRAIVQKVKNANVKINNQIYSEINEGLLVCIAFTNYDSEADMDYIIRKIIGLRIFMDDKNKMNLSLKDIEGELLIVSQFTLYGDVRRGYRPSFDQSAKPIDAKKMYDVFLEKLSKEFDNFKTGVFAAHMEISLTNDGPVTIQLDSNKIY